MPKMKHLGDKSRLGQPTPDISSLVNWEAESSGAGQSSVTYAFGKPRWVSQTGALSNDDRPMHSTKDAYESLRDWMILLTTGTCDESHSGRIRANRLLVCSVEISGEKVQSVTVPT